MRVGKTRGYPRTMPLSDLKIRNAKPTEVGYRLPDGDGLHLFVTPAGGKWWRIRFRFGGREQLLSIGSYPTMTLAQARERRAEVRADLKAKRDPRREAVPEPVAAPVGPTFREIALQWHAIEASRWKPSHAIKVAARLEKEVFPALGGLQADAITAPIILKSLLPMQARAAIGLAHRVRGYISCIFAYGLAAGICTGNPAAGIQRAMMHKLPDGHLPAVTSIEDARRVLRALDLAVAYPVTRLAIRLLALTAVRPGELRVAEWAEFHIAGEAPTWQIPAAHMKGGRRPHIVPLSRQAVDTLRVLRGITPGCVVAFPAKGNTIRPISKSTISDTLRRAGLKGQQVPHGWRASFSTIMNERSRADRWVIDQMLAHTPKDPVEAAYNRSTNIDRRREIAQEWADLLMVDIMPPEQLLNLPRNRIS